MIRAACWTCALLALASARVFERCELARDLREMGVQRDHISTWVCIAYHESRLDTTSHNHYSGDHGIFQISELFWCGPGKACGMPCSALRDDDIYDDVQCALQIHEEHTRIQGDGYLAWVVYPQFCKHNTKKYVIDCDSQHKNTLVKSTSKSRVYNFDNINKTSNYNKNIDELKPPYLTINSILQSEFSKSLRPSSGRSGSTNWLNYKIDNIDDLTLPVFNKNSANMISVPTTTITVTTASNSTPRYYKKYVETKQFRKRILPDDIDTVGVIYTHKPTNNRINNSVFVDKSITNGTSTAATSKIVTSTIKVENTRPATIFKPLISTTTPKLFITRTTKSSQDFFAKSTLKPTTIRPVSTTFKTTTYKENLRATNITTSFVPVKFTTSTFMPKLHALSTSTRQSKNYGTSPTTKRTTYINKVVPTTTRPVTSPYISSFTKRASFLNDRRSAPLSTSTTTEYPFKITASHPSRVTRSTTLFSSPQTSTQSIFDLYLNPTRTPKLRTYKFAPVNNSAYNLKIFSSGTTTPVPKNNRDTRTGVARNYVRRQTSQT